MVGALRGGGSDPLAGGYALFPSVPEPGRTVPPTALRGPAVKKSSPLLTAYRVFAYVTGVGLILLCASCIAYYGFGKAEIAVAIVGTIHGWAYMVYVVLAFSVGNKLGWPIKKMAFVILAGTIPTCSFIAERKVMKQIDEQLAAAQPEQLVKA
jgi:integral membrane protein